MTNGEQMSEASTASGEKPVNGAMRVLWQVLAGLFGLFAILLIVGMVVSLVVGGAVWHVVGFLLPAAVITGLISRFAYRKWLAAQA